MGKCTSCQQFGTVSENVGSTQNAGYVGLKGKGEVGRVIRSARPVNTIDTRAHGHIKTGIGEFDRILNGGIVAGQTILIAGEPGCGKSTLLLMTANSYAMQEKTVLYISGEESAEQITLRARRTNSLSDNLFIADETDLSILMGHIEEVNPDLLIVDSVQTIASADVDSRAGGVSQVQEVATTLTRIAKARHMPLILVGQVTKDGTIGGPRQLEHLVDTVAEFFGDKNTPLRLLRIIKNRFGPSDEVSCWEQTETGIVEVSDPSGLFRTGRSEPVPGTCITVTMEGRRAILAEVQALVAHSNAPNPRRGVSGLDTARMAMLVAVTEKHGGLRLFDKDTFLATVAGMRIIEPAADLAVCLALASAGKDLPLPLDVCAIGEVALSGDIRSTTNMTLRLNEAARLGFKRILVPVGTEKPSKLDVVLIPLTHLGKAMSALKQLSPGVRADTTSEEE
jgi:DNA repair protein RadA/Sms